MQEDTYLCPGCNKEVRVGSRRCPYCNPPSKRRRKPKATAKNARRSWEQSPTGDGLDLPDEDFDYDKFVAREFGRSPHLRIGIKWYWWVTALFLLVLILLAGIRLAG